ncbi:MAG: hypothetical protein OEX12_10885 [Gammaproteobacteria bacterium]|nr:hypothetical protein [Gammaproteobacteria bacterium]
MTHQPYRPSNATEGDIFEANWCNHCQHMQDYRQTQENCCDILLRAHAFSTTNAAFPTEWQRQDTGPTCTAYLAEGEVIQYRCSKTQDMFGDQA